MIFVIPIDKPEVRPVPQFRTDDELVKFLRSSFDRGMAQSKKKRKFTHEQVEARWALFLEEFEEDHLLIRDRFLPPNLQELVQRKIHLRQQKEQNSAA